MKFGAPGLVLCLVMAGCGDGTPFNGGETTDTGGDGTTGAIPETLAGSLASFTYNPATQTLSIENIAGDNNAVDGIYRRRPDLDRVGYEAYTAQDASNGRHSTAYVRDVNGTRAAVVATGVQYQQLYAGAAYSSQNYSPRVAPGSNNPDSGLVYYTGRYVGLLNGPGSSEDLQAPNKGESPSVLTKQAAEVTGDMQITGDFATSNVDGIIYNRVIRDYDSGGNLDPNSANPFQDDDIALLASTIAADGTFLGTAEQNLAGIGEYGGIFGGTGATEVAGIIRVSDHIPGTGTAIEHGVFVLSECTPPLSGPDCNLSPATP